MNLVRVVIVDDHPLVHNGIIDILRKYQHIKIVGQGYDGASLMPLLAEHEPDILLLDHQMPQSKADGSIGNDFHAYRAVQRIRQNYPDIRIIIITMIASPVTIRRAIRAGVHGYVVKGDWVSEQMADVITKVQNGQVYISPTALDRLAQAHVSLIDNEALTARHIEILAELERNRNHKQVVSAEKLNISPYTLNNHLHKIRQILHVETTQAAISYARENGII